MILKKIKTEQNFCFVSWIKYWTKIMSIKRGRYDTITSVKFSEQIRLKIDILVSKSQPQKVKIVT